MLAGMFILGVIAGGALMAWLMAYWIDRTFRNTRFW